MRWAGARRPGVAAADAADAAAEAEDAAEARTAAVDVSDGEAAAAVSEVRSQRRRSNDEDRKRAERNEWQKRVSGALRRERDDDR